MTSSCYARPILMKLEFSRQIFEEYSHIEFHENPSRGSRNVQWGHTDRPTDRCDEANSLSSQFCKRALTSAVLGGVLCCSVWICNPGRVRTNRQRCWTHTYRESTQPRKWLVPSASSRHLADCLSWRALLQLLHQHGGQCAVLRFQFLDASL